MRAASILLVGLMPMTLSTPVWADWTRAGGNSEFDNYVDLDTIRRRGNTAQMWSLFDMKAPQEVQRIKYLSQKAKREFDCEGEQLKVLQFSLHPEHMGKGEPVFSFNWIQEELEWTPVTPGSINQVLWQIACER